MKLAFSTYSLILEQESRKAIFLTDEGVGHLMIRGDAPVAPNYDPAANSVVVALKGEETELFKGAEKDCEAVYRSVIASFRGQEKPKGRLDRVAASVAAVALLVAGGTAFGVFGNGSTAITGNSAVTASALSASVSPVEPAAFAPPEVTPIVDSQATTSAPTLISGTPEVEPGPEPVLALPNGEMTGTFGDRASEAERTSETTLEAARETIEEQGVEGGMANIALLQSALEAVQSGQKIDPSILDQLPHDVASRLREADALLTDEETAAVTGSTDLVTLDVATLDRYRDEDGIPTVLPSNSWELTGGMVRIPPPGGGDIRSAADFAQFGFEG